MKEIVIGQAMPVKWQRGDIFTLLLSSANILVDIPPEPSEERSALLNAMRDRRRVQVIIRVPEDGE